MENQVIFRANQDLDPSDFNNLQDYVQASIDHIVGDALTAARGFAGFGATVTGAAKVTIDAGRLYSAGAVYVRATSIDFDLTTALPLTGKKNVLILVAGSEQDTDATPREFLIDEATMAAQPQTVTTRHARVSSVNTVVGAEAPDPTDPLFDPGYFAVARILLSPTGVSTVTMLEDNRLISIDRLAAEFNALTDVTDQVRTKVGAIDSNVASLTARVTGTVGQGAFGRALVRLADLEAKDGIPSSAADSAADYFLDPSSSLLTDPSSSCSVMEGIRFPDDGVASGPLVVANPLNTVSQLLGGVLFPAFDLVERVTVGPATGQLQASAYTYTTQDVVEKQMTRTRIRYGTPFTVCTNAGWWGAITSQYVPETFQHDGENFQTLSVDWDGPTHGWVRVQEFWYDTYEEPYWAAVTIDHQVPGAQIAETFLLANDMWLGAISLNFTKLAAVGGLTMIVCETDRGMPDPSNAISVTSVDRGTMALGKCQIPIQPVFLQGGKRYAVLIITAADHWLATTPGTNFPGGTLFYVLDGAYQQGDGTRDLVFSLHALKFRSARTVVDLGAQQLAGGISAIDILADTVVPGSTSLTFQVQIAGQWLPLDPANPGILLSGGAPPPLVPMQVVMTGTPDVQPALKVLGSTCRLSRPKLAFVHIWGTQALPGGGSTQIRVIKRLEYFDANHHTSATKLLTGAGFATVTAPSAVVDTVDTDGSIIRTSVFNLPAAVMAFRVRSEGTTDAIGRPWHVAWLKFYAL